jgi:hypothetical protein
MRSKALACVLFGLGLALFLTISARSKDKDHDGGDRDRDRGNECRDDENFEHQTKTPVQVVGVIPIPGLPVSASDIIFADPVTERVYWSDRSNAGIDILDAEHSVFIARIPGFVGNVGAGGGTTTTNDKGPNGVLATPNRLLWAGDGNSQLHIMQLDPSQPGYLTIIKTISLNPVPGVGPGGSTLPACDDGANHYCERSDELGYDSKDHLIFIMNDEPQALASPHGAITPYGSFVDTKTFQVVAQVQFAGAGGAEQPVWDPGLQRFLVTIPGTASPFQQSRVAVVKPGASTVEKYYNLGDISGIANCSTANGLALGANQHALASACGAPIIFNVSTGKLINLVTQVAPGDEVWANPGDGRFYVGSTDNTSTATPKPTTLGVIDQQTGKWLQNVAAPGTQNPTAFAETNTIFAGVRKPSTTPDTSVCAKFGYSGTGCVAVFDHTGEDDDR